MPASTVAGFLPGMKEPSERPGVVVVDARGLSCPLPLLEARRALALLPGGATIVVLATDPAAPDDFMEFSEATGHELTDVVERDDMFRLTLVKRLA